MFSNKVSIVRSIMTSNSTAATASKFKIALVQLAVTADKQHNIANASSKIREAAKNGANLVMLPECFNCPYGNAYFDAYSEQLEDSPTMRAMSEVAKEAKVTLVAGSFPTRDGERKRDDGKPVLFNTCTVFDKTGNRIALFHKMHMFDINVIGGISFRESESLSPGSRLACFQTEDDSSAGKFGLGICFDVRFAEMAQLYQRDGCQMLLYPGAFNMTTGPLHWELLARARAVDNQLFVAMCSPARDMTAKYNAWGHSLVVDPWGRIIAEAQGDEQGEQIVYADVDLSLVESFRNQIPTIKNKRLDLYDVVDKNELLQQDLD